MIARSRAASTAGRAWRSAVCACMAAAALVGASCTRPTGATPEDARRAREVLAPFKRKLMATLERTVEEEGPEKAIEVCRLEAPRIAEEAGAGGVRIGRTSHRLRNPANAPEPWMEPLLVQYLSDPEDREPKTVRLESGEIGYVEPIVLMAMCTTCHGEDIHPSVQEKLDALYPEDRATGFSRGDLRGMFWVRLPSD